MRLSKLMVTAVTIAKVLTSESDQLNYVELREMPELGYVMSDLDGNPGYAYYDDTLIVGQHIYQKEGERYQKTGNVTDLVGLEEFCAVAYAQYKNFLIIVGHTKEFYIYDMDTWTYECIEVDMHPVWGVYQGQIMYKDNEDGDLWTYNIMTGERRNFDILYKDKERYSFFRCVIRDGGKMIISRYNRENHYLEFYIPELSENGVLKERKIWETNDWEYAYSVDYNQYGWVLLGEFYYVIDGIGLQEVIVIKENGEVERLDIRLRGEHFFLDDGYLLSDITYVGELEDTYEEVWKGVRAVTSVSLYDYAGNKKRTYQLVDEELLKKGFYLEKLLYDNGLITGFYIQEGTDELYISQVRAK